MNYVENVAAFIQFCIENEEKLPCFEKKYDGTSTGKQHLFNYCDEPAYDMNHLVLDVYKHLGKQKKCLVHFSYSLAYLGGKCFDLLAFILHKKFAVNSIRVKKFCTQTCLYEHLFQVIKSSNDRFCRSSFTRGRFASHNRLRVCEESSGAYFQL